MARFLGLCRDACVALSAPAPGAHATLLLQQHALLARSQQALRVDPAHPPCAPHPAHPTLSIHPAPQVRHRPEVRRTLRLAGQRLAARGHGAAVPERRGGGRRDCIPGGEPFLGCPVCCHGARIALSAALPSRGGRPFSGVTAFPGVGPWVPARSKGGGPCVGCALGARQASNFATPCQAARSGAVMWSS